MRDSSDHASIHECLSEVIVDADGKPAGEICDLLLDRRTGHIDFVRVAIPAEPARDRRYITIPWSALRIPQNAEQLWGVRAKRETLEKMSRREVRFE